MNHQLDKFYVGCNYWASNAGTEMWRQFDEEVIDRDFEALSQNGSDTLRIFPNWRDFQPVTCIVGYAGAEGVYRMEDGSADGAPLPNRYMLSPLMLERMKKVCDLAQKHRLKLIVSIVTGWMSGRLFTPPVLNGKNAITSPEALRLEALFCEGLVRYLKDCPAVEAWDLGNECNCMGKAVSRHESWLWTYTLSSAIRLADPDRPILSGMHSLQIEPDQPWSMAEQGELTDCLTNHPYTGSGSIAADGTGVGSYRGTILPTAQQMLYTWVSGKPSMIEEQGTLNHIYANKEISAMSARANLISSWAHGGCGYLWWCAFDQKNLDFYPYTMSMRELGWMCSPTQPKPITGLVKATSDELNALGLKKRMTPQIDAVCIHTNGQDWRVSEMPFLLGKQAGMTVATVWQDGSIPTAPLYLLPSIKGWTTLTKNTLLELYRRVYEDGAALYVSWNGGVLENFEEYFALLSNGQKKTAGLRRATFLFPEGEKELSWQSADAHLCLSTLGAKVLAKDEEGNAVFSVASYGKGKLFFLDFGLEDILFRDTNSFEGGSAFVPLYRMLADGAGISHPLTSANPSIGITFHREGESLLAVLVNYTSEKQETLLTIQEGFRVNNLRSCDWRTLEGGDYAILKLE